MKTRVLSAVLAILMILVVCPVITLSAADGDVSVWDGKVAGTDKTLKELQLAYNADPDNYVVIEVTKESIKSDLNVIDAVKPNTSTKEWHIHTGAGLAFMSAWANGYVKFSDWDVSYATAAAAQIIRMKTNIDLNNQPWIPICAYTTGAEAAKFVFSGEGYYISNMNITETADLDMDYRCFGLFGSFHTKQTTAQIVNLAVVDATIDITVNQPATDGKAVYVGGIVGLVTCGNLPNTVNDKVYFNNNVVDANITLTTNGSAEVLAVAGIDDVQYQAAVGGQVGYAENLGNIELNNLVSSGKIEIKKTNATDTPVAAGGLIAASNGTATKLKTNVGLMNMGIVGVTMPDGTVPYYGMTNCNGNGGATAVTTALVWSMVSSMAQTIGGNPVIDAEKSNASLIFADVAGNDNPLKNRGWTQPSGENRFPLPSQFATNYTTIEASLYDAFFNNLGASVRTKVDEAGLRFSVELSQALTDLGATEYGLLLIPKSLLTDELTVDTANVLKVTVPAEKTLDKDAGEAVHIDRWGCGDTSKQFNVALIGIPDANVDTDFVARPYAVLGEGDSARTVYGNTIERNLVDVVETIMTSGSAADQAAVYDAYKNNASNFGEKFNAYVPQA